MSGKTKARIAGIAGALLLLALIFHFTGLSEAKSITLIATSVIAGYPIVLKALQSLRMKAFSIELLVSIAIIGAMFIGEYVESAVVSFLFLFGAYLEARTLEKTRTSLKSLMDMAPLEATVIRNGKKVVIAADDVEMGDHVFIQSGEKIAVDGRVVKGTAAVNEAAITGESVLAKKDAGIRVFSGTIVDSGYLEVVAEKVGDDTQFAKIIELVEEAQESKTKTEKFLERFANIYTPAIVILSVLVYLFTRNIELTLTFLVIACPGALVISAPVSIVAGIGNGAKHGVLVKGGEIIERLAKQNTMVFDKTGTLTMGAPAVTDIRSLAGAEDEFLQYVAEAETISEHHLGRTIVKEARKRGIELVHEPQHVEIVKGGGIIAEVGGKRIAAGTRKLMKHLHIPIPETEEAYAAAREKAGNTAVFAAIGIELAGIISIADEVRPEAKTALHQLKANGIRELYMLTGDNRHTAELVGAQLGIDHVLAEMLPENKVEEVNRLKNEGRRVVMTGDGINDAPAIATADVGIAMGGSGTDVSMETADVVLMSDRLDQLAHAYSLAKATVRNMKQNTFFAVGTVIFLLIGVLFQKVFLASGMLIHELSVLLVILNALRLVRYKPARK